MIPDFLQVFSGDFTVESDKEEIVDIVIGLWAHSVWHMKTLPKVAELLLDKCNTDMFPKKYFGDLLDLTEKELDNLFQRKTVYSRGGGSLITSCQESLAQSGMLITTSSSVNSKISDSMVQECKSFMEQHGAFMQTTSTCLQTTSTCTEADVSTETLSSISVASQTKANNKLASDSIGGLSFMSESLAIDMLRSGIKQHVKFPMVESVLESILIEVAPEESSVDSAGPIFSQIPSVFSV
jgi:ornithine carbamoyltransferase